MVGLALKTRQQVPGSAYLKEQAPGQQETLSIRQDVQPQEEEPQPGSHIQEYMHVPHTHTHRGVDKAEETRGMEMLFWKIAMLSFN